MEAQLIANIKNGIDVDNNLLQLHQQYARVVSRLAKRRKMQKDEAYAISLSTLWKCAKSYDYRSKFITYYWTALDNAFLKDLRKRMKHNLLVQMEDDSDFGMPEDIETALCIEDPRHEINNSDEAEIKKKELLDAIQNSDLLTTRELQVFLLLRQHERHTVAKMLNISQERVRQLIESIRLRVRTGKKRRNEYDN
jgi:RNA polymerase sigma factor (sigma-70 family)